MRFYFKVFATLGATFFSLGLNAQTAAPATNKPPTPAIAAEKSPAVNYEQLLDEYFSLNFGNDEFKKGIIKLYRRTSGKTDAKYSYVETPEFENEALRVFKENWKTIARKNFTAADLQYLIIYNKSTLRKKLSKVEFEAYDTKVLGKLFDEIPAKPASQPSTATPPKR